MIGEDDFICADSKTTRNRIDNWNLLNKCTRKLKYTYHAFVVVVCKDFILCDNKLTKTSKLARPISDSPYLGFAHKRRANLENSAVFKIRKKQVLPIDLLT